MRGTVTVRGMMVLVASLVAAGLGGQSARGAEGSAAKAAPAGRATIDTTPEQYYQGAQGNAARRMTGKYTGNSWTWHARFPMHGFLDAYLATRDPAWLDAAAKYFDWNVGLLLVGPDGFQGWLGPVSGAPDKLSEHPIGDAIMLEPMVRFAELVLKDEPALAAKYGDQARVYAALAGKLMFEKWRKRGTWHEDGPYGVFTEWPWYYTEQAADTWHEPAPGTRAITLPFNMQVHWGMVAARLHRITGDDAWRDTALRLFAFLKSRLCLYQDHYSWNYWEPFGPWDVDPGNPQAFRHWIGTHPYRDYQAGEIEGVVTAYHHGLAFDADDMKRFVNTNLKVMWTGSLDDIKWNNSDAGVKKGAWGEVRLASKPKGIFNRYAGTLWTPMAEFDATARKILERQLKTGSYQHAYYRNVTARHEPSYARRSSAGKPRGFDFPFSSCCTLTMVAVMPSVVARGRPAVVSCMTRVEGDLAVDLYSADGTKRLAALREAAPHPRGILNLPWAAEDTPPGRYRVRWTLRGQHRDFPVTVK